jgi:LmbE family N-acetylglucosaminyl deacetylase
MRRREFSEALRILDVDHGEILDYPDGRLAEQNFLEVTAKLIERIRHYRPQIVLTFGPDGNVNLHPDHTMVSFFATAAFYWAGRDLPLTTGLLEEQTPYQPQKLYYSMAPFLVRKTAEQTRQTPLCPASLVLKLGDLTPRKIQAFRMHTSQVPILDRLGKTFEDAAGEERYLLISAPGIRLIHPERSMFEGLSEELDQPQPE